MDRIRLEKDVSRYRCLMPYHPEHERHYRQLPRSHRQTQAIDPQWNHRHLLYPIVPTEHCQPDTGVSSVLLYRTTVPPESTTIMFFSYLLLSHIMAWLIYKQLQYTICLISYNNEDCARSPSEMKPESVYSQWFAERQFRT